MYTEFMSLEEFRKLQQTRVMKRSRPRPPSEGEETLAQQLTAYKIPFRREVRFHRLRLWRLDFVLELPRPPIAIECEGGVYNKGAHTRGKHFESDCIKYSEAILAGFRVFRFSTGQIKKGIAIQYICRAIGKKL